jgi:hypothetical protein
VAASLRDDFDPLFIVSVGLVGAETLVLIARRFECPLTSVAKRYTDDRSPTFDIYLPHWVAKYNIPIFATILVLAVLANVFVRLRVRREVKAAGIEPDHPQPINRLMAHDFRSNCPTTRCLLP